MLIDVVPRAVEPRAATGERRSALRVLVLCAAVLHATVPRSSIAVLSTVVLHAAVLRACAAVLHTAVLCATVQHTAELRATVCEQLRTQSGTAFFAAVLWDNE